METLLQDPDTAERIADNNVRTFRERYLTPAAETCYWRALWDGWAEVSPDITKVVESGDPGERGLRYEAFILLDSNEMLQFSFRDYIDGN